MFAMSEAKPGGLFSEKGSQSKPKGFGPPRIVDSMGGYLGGCVSQSCEENTRGTSKFLKA